MKYQQLNLFEMDEVGTYRVEVLGYTDDRIYGIEVDAVSEKDAISKVVKNHHEYGWYSGIAYSMKQACYLARKRLVFPGFLGVVQRAYRIG